MPHRFDPRGWERLVSVERRELLDPERVLDLLGVMAGATAADIGCGPGFFTLPLAARVGPTGRVHALDVSPDMLAALESRGPPPQVTMRVADAATLPLPDASVDVALLAFVFHETEPPEATLREVRRVLRPGGRLAVLEWVPKDEEIGPPLEERVPQADCEAAIVAEGFEIEQSLVLNRSQYMIVASRGAAAG